MPEKHHRECVMAGADREGPCAYCAGFDDGYRRATREAEAEARDLGRQIERLGAALVEKNEDVTRLKGMLASAAKRALGETR